MTEFEFDNLPDELNVEALPEDLFDEAFSAFSDAVFSGRCVAREVKAAYVYGRKGFMEADAFGGKRSASYTSTSDDVVLQVTVRIQHPRGEDLLRKAAVLETVLVERRIVAERTRLEAEIAAEEAAVTEALERAAKKREQLKELGNS